MDHPESNCTSILKYGGQVRSSDPRPTRCEPWPIRWSGEHRRSSVANVARASRSEGDEACELPRSRKGVQTRARLVEAAKKVFERDGFLEARIVDIAEAANLAPGGFYHYFDSKEELFLEVAQMQEERLTASTEDRSADRDKTPPTESIRQANRLYLERYRDEAALMGVIEQVSRYDEDVNVARMATMKHFVERAERSIRRLQREGERRSPPRTVHGGGRPGCHDRLRGRAVAGPALPGVPLRHGRRATQPPLGQCAGPHRQDRIANRRDARTGGRATGCRRRRRNPSASPSSSS